VFFALEYPSQPPQEQEGGDRRPKVQRTVYDALGSNAHAPTRRVELGIGRWGERPSGCLKFGTWTQVFGTAIVQHSPKEPDHGCELSELVTRPGCLQRVCFRTKGERPPGRSEAAATQRQ